jgi:hypothetical protein
MCMEVTRAINAIVRICHKKTPPTLEVFPGDLTGAPALREGGGVRGWGGSAATASAFVTLEREDT